MTKYYECRYVRREDPGDLLWGFIWRPAVVVDDSADGALFRKSSAEIEQQMFDKDTGQNVGDTRNYCVNPNCWHEDCAPMRLIAEV